MHSIKCWKRRSSSTCGSFKDGRVTLVGNYARRAPTCATPSTPSTFASMCSAFIAAAAYILAGLSWSMKVSGKTIERNLRPRSKTPSSARSWATWLPKPPIAPSSIVISASCSRGEAEDQVAVERLGEAGVGDRRAEAAGGERLGGLQAFGEARAEGEERDARCPPDDPAAADLERACRARASRRRRPRRAESGRRRGGRRCAAAVATMCTQLGLVGGGHHHEAGQVREIGDVEGAGVGRAVRADEPGAVDGEAHRQALERDVVDDLVVAALEEGRVDRAERASCPPAASPAAKVTACCSAMPTSKQRSGNALGELVHAGAVGHRGGDRDDALVGLGLARSAPWRRPWCSSARPAAFACAPVPR